MSRSTSRRKLPSQPAATKPRSHLDLAIYLGLILTVFAVYSQVGHFDFVIFDDPAYVTGNARVRAGLAPESIGYALTHIVDANWIPLTILSHMAVCQLFGMESGAHHWVNVVLHALSALLLFAFFRRATGALWPSAFVAFVFALHPLHVESVAWVTERKDVLSTFFLFLALYAYCRYTERPDPQRYLLVLASFCLGLMAKPMLVTFPFLLLLLDVWPFRRAQWPRVVIEKLPFFALSLASASLTYFAQRSDGAVQTVPFGVGVRNALISYLVYIRQAFWPVRLIAYYPFPKSIAMWQAAAALAVLLCVSALAIFAWRTRPYLATGWFWYLGTLVPVIGLVQVGAQAHADRYMYVPLAGLSVVVAFGAADIVAKWPRATTAVAATAILSCLACLGLAWAQAQYWGNTETLYQRALAVNQDNFFVQYGLGDYLLQFPDRGAEAVTHFEEALRINPQSANSHNSIGGYLLQTGRYAEATAQFEAALQIKPDLAAAHFNLGQIYSKNPERVADAIAHYQAALRAQPDFERAQRNLGLLLVRLGRTSEAIAHFEAAQRLGNDPEVAEILDALRAQQR